MHMARPHVAGGIGGLEGVGLGVGVRGVGLGVVVWGKAQRCAAAMPP